MRKERDKWKQRCKEAEKELKSCQDKLARAQHVQEAVERSRKKVKGHSYSSLLTDVALKIRCNTSCGASDVSKILDILNEATGGEQPTSKGDII